MIKGLRIIGGLMVAIGAVWIGQGLGYIGGSFMTGQPLWIWIGFAVAMLGAASFAISPRQ